MRETAPSSAVQDYSVSLVRCVREGGLSSVDQVHTSGVVSRLHHLPTVLTLGISQAHLGADISNSLPVKKV